MEAKGDGKLFDKIRYVQSVRKSSLWQSFSRPALSRCVISIRFSASSPFIRLLISCRRILNKTSVPLPFFETGYLCLPFSFPPPTLLGVESRERTAVRNDRATSSSLSSDSFINTSVSKCYYRTKWMSEQNESPRFCAIRFRSLRIDCCLRSRQNFRGRETRLNFRYNNVLLHV